MVTFRVEILGLWKAEVVLKSTRELKTISVIVPVFDPNGEYRNFLHDLLASVADQSISPLEVVLSANHPLPYFPSLMQSFSDRLQIVFHQNESSSAPENINFGVSVARGDIIKVLFQDDFLIDKGVFASAQRVSLQEPWRVFASQNTDRSGELTGRKIFPMFTDRLVEGENLIGAPSVVAFLRGSFVAMDSRLPYLFDVDWYLSMAHNHGFPTYETVTSVGIRIHEGQATHWAKFGMKAELKVLRRKHPKSSGLACPCSEPKHRSR